jgi:hypothetical protein
MISFWFPAGAGAISNSTYSLFSHKIRFGKPSWVANSELLKSVCVQIADEKLTWERFAKLNFADDRFAPWIDV